MDLPNPKELKKLADTCRKCGIKSFQSSQFSFTLSDEAPVSNYKKKVKTKEQPYTEDTIQTDSFTDEQMLMWSTGGNTEENQ